MPMQSLAGPGVQGRQFHISGQVQGVGFRPFVQRLAESLGLTGEVANDAAGVWIKAWGEDPVLNRFDQLLREQAPPMALIESVEQQPLQQQSPPASFQIVTSTSGEVRVGVTPDATVCSECLSELFNPLDRRYRYPFINCTNCGPRYSLIRKLPYDRPYTTMAVFKLCEYCRSEYQDPKDRRFHAQPNACPDCGPRLSLHQPDGVVFECLDPLAEALSLLRQGKIIAIKGIGGFHLVCDANNVQAVAELRRRKQRDQKPFALMAANPSSLRQWVQLNSARIERLQAVDAPIVLCPAKAPQSLPGIAPGLAWFGVMLPHTPLHYLLFHQAAGCPVGLEWLEQPQQLLLVMTSANPSGEPLVTDNDEAFQRLSGLADAILLHDRAIHIRCDDSVVHGGGLQCGVQNGALPLIRRGRGLAPQVIALPQKWRNAPSILATGALLKNTVCLTQGNRAYVSQHIGDLDNPSCCRALEQTVNHLCELFEIEPQAVVHDLHPDNFASQFAQRFAAERNLPSMAVQHHQAHIAAVLAEQGDSFDPGQPVLGLALDGFGLGADGTLWGGELLRLEGGDYQRLGHLQPLALPGGDKAAREPWRMAASAMHLLGRSDEISGRLGAQPGAAMIAQMLDKGVNSPLTSSCGRLFDAVAGLLDIQPVAAFEAQPAMMLESLAQCYLQHNDWPEEELLLFSDPQGRLDTKPLLARLLALHDSGADSGYAAALLHRQLIDGLSLWLSKQARQQRLSTVVLSGGCLLNQLLCKGLQQQLEAHSLQVMLAEKLPCNDGGLSLGQAWLGLQSFQSRVN